MVSNIRFHTGNKEMLLQLCSLRIQGGPNLFEKPPPKSTSISPKCSGTTQEVRNTWATFKTRTWHSIPLGFCLPRQLSHKITWKASLTIFTNCRKKHVFHTSHIVLIGPFSNEHTSLTTFDTWWVFFAHSGQSRCGLPISNIKNSHMRSAMFPNGYNNSVKTDFSIAITVLHQLHQLLLPCNFKPVNP